MYTYMRYYKKGQIQIYNTINLSNGYMAQLQRAVHYDIKTRHILELNFTI